MASAICDCGSSEIQVQRGVHSCLKCGNVLQNLNFQLLQGDRYQKLEVKRHDFQLERMRAINAKAMAAQVRLQRWRLALAKLCGQLKLQDAIQDSAFRLLQHRLSKKAFRGPKERHKLLGCACLVVAASKHNVGAFATIEIPRPDVVTGSPGAGLTLEEVATKCQVKVNLLQKMLWKVCKETGVQPSRNEGNAEALLMRICRHLNITQTGGVCAYGCKLVSIASQGWICTGRKWSFIVAAAFMLAAQAFFYLIEVQDVARFLRLGTGTIELRLKEIKELLLSVMQHLPWGHVIDISNIHVYLPFALEHWDVLHPVAPILRKQQIEKQQKRQKALEEFLHSNAFASRGSRSNSSSAGSLRGLIKTDDDPSVRLAALDALQAVAGVGSRHLKEAALHLVLDEDDVVRDAAAEILEHLDLTEEEDALPGDLDLPVIEQESLGKNIAEEPQGSTQQPEQGTSESQDIGEMGQRLLGLAEQFQSLQSLDLSDQGKQMEQVLQSQDQEALRQWLHEIFPQLEGMLTPGPKYPMGVYLDELRVMEIFEGSPAEKAGILIGDILHKVNGVEITTQEELRKELDVAGDKCLLVERAGGEVEVMIHLGGEHQLMQEGLAMAKGRSALSKLQRPGVGGFFFLVAVLALTATPFVFTLAREVKVAKGWRLSRHATPDLGSSYIQPLDVEPTTAWARIEEVKNKLRGYDDLPKYHHRPAVENAALVWWFLRDRRLDVNEATEKLVKCLRWRQRFRVEYLGPDMFPKELRSGKGYVHQHPDIAGRPVMVAIARRHSIFERDLLESSRMCCWMLETALKRLAMLEPPSTGTKKLAPPVPEQALGIFDLREFSPLQADLEVAGFLIEVLYNYYPARTGKVLLVGAPDLFKAFWDNIKPLLGRYAKLADFVTVDELRENYFKPGLEPPEFRGVARAAMPAMPAIPGMIGSCLTIAFAGATVVAKSPRKRGRTARQASLLGVGSRQISLDTTAPSMEQVEKAIDLLQSRIPSTLKWRGRPAAENRALLWWFLRDRKMDVAEAASKLLKCLRWRDDFSVENLGGGCKSS
eukprot:symbB.v1.2.008162.t1/scaffold512.1/size193505/3